MRLAQRAACALAWPLCHPLAVWGSARRAAVLCLRPASALRWLSDCIRCDHPPCASWTDRPTPPAPFSLPVTTLSRTHSSPAGNLSRARPLFRRALELEPSSAFVLQAWGVAEARRGSKRQARSLLQRATEADPGCRAAWHAWGKLEDEAGNAEVARGLYQRVLELAPGSVPTLSALGCLERRAGDLAAAERHLSAALAAQPAHLPSLYELATVREAQGRVGEAAALRRSAARLASSRRQALEEAAAGKLPSAVAAQ